MDGRELGIFIMGGTIDSRNDPNLDGEAIPLRSSLVQKYLESLHPDFRMQIQVICMKDSRNITEEDEEQLFQAIQAEGLERNLVTVGTYRMLDLARKLFEKKLGDNKVVTLTGAMATFIGSVDEEGHLSPSDAAFNLGYAISETFQADHGVYQAMDGSLFRQPDQEWWHDEAGVHRTK